MRTSRRAAATATAVVLLAAGAAVALVPFEAGDTYCDRPLWDATRSPPCDGRMVASTLAAALAAAAAVAGASVATAVAGRRR